MRESRRMQKSSGYLWFLRMNLESSKHHPQLSMLKLRRVLLLVPLTTPSPPLRAQHVLHLLAQSAHRSLHLTGRNRHLRRSQRSGKAELGVDTLNAVRGVDVLDQGDLVASRGALARDDGGVCKEVLPDLEPTSLTKPAAKI